MINTIKIKVAAYLLLTTGALLFTVQAQAQVQLNLTGNYLGPTETGSGSSFSDGLWGGSATLRYFVSPKLAVGLNGRYFTQSESADFDAGTGVAGTVETSSNLLLVTGQAEYFFSESALRPYIGLEAGLYRSTGKFEITGIPQYAGTESFNENNFGVAPKVGLQYAITPAFGLNVDAGYHIIFSDGETGKALLLGAGVFFTFGQ